MALGLLRSQKGFWYQQTSLSRSSQKETFCTRLAFKVALFSRGSMDFCYTGTLTSSMKTPKVNFRLQSPGSQGSHEE